MKGPYLGFKPASSAPEAALVTTIPGFNGTLPSKHYSGYVTLDESHGKRLFYYFVESKRNSAKDPIVLWLNGGPGCSSFDGFIYEHGPFNFEARKPRGSLPKLYLNPYSWSKVSSVLYLDSPTGVGFSYSGYESDYITGDLKTSSDSHSFLLKWFELYPEFISNPFYISGESYAGVYVPTLPHEVAQGIATGVKPILNFKWYMVGNGVTDDVFDGNDLVPFAHGMGLISDELFECLLVKGWKGTIWCFPRGKKSKDEEDHKCAIREVLEEMGFNVSILLNKDDHIEMIFRQQRVRLYIIAGVKDDTYFAPQTMKEISIRHILYRKILNFMSP
ncbi:serine carboxypeptidase 1 [Phtheirospermum japonicum]|uniref:Carboxypeptidase n=1 Tax=Phtheirospermum japonicum TaxID=374723 RepID=A0A830BK61_9LAMI|nr:serine carboxypeptidase 1 [Phtheirospermum japonicum]